MVSETSSYHGYPICRLVGPSIEGALGEYDRKRGHESSFVESLCTFEVTPSPATPLLPPPLAGIATGVLRYMWHRWLASTHLPSKGNVLNARHAILYFSLELLVEISITNHSLSQSVELGDSQIQLSEALLRVAFTSNCCLFFMI